MSCTSPNSTQRTETACQTSISSPASGDIATSFPIESSLLRSHILACLVPNAQEVKHENAQPEMISNTVTSEHELRSLAQPIDIRSNAVLPESDYSERFPDGSEGAGPVLTDSVMTNSVPPEGSQADQSHAEDMADVIRRADMAAKEVRQAIDEQANIELEIQSLKDRIKQRKKAYEAAGRRARQASLLLQQAELELRQANPAHPANPTEVTIKDQSRARSQSALMDCSLNSSGTPSENQTIEQTQSVASSASTTADHDKEIRETLSKITREHQVMKQHMSEQLTMLGELLNFIQQLAFPQGETMPQTTCEDDENGASLTDGFAAHHRELAETSRRVQGSEVAA